RVNGGSNYDSLAINHSKSFTVSITNVPHVKKSIVNKSVTFQCGGKKLESLCRTSNWNYLGVSFTPEGIKQGDTLKKMTEYLQTLSSAPLKLHQRLFALRTVALPRVSHHLTLGYTTLSCLKKIDNLVRKNVKKLLNLPHDTSKAYVHADAKDGGLSIPSLRCTIPMLRRERLTKLHLHESMSDFCQQQIAIAERRLTEGNKKIFTKKASKDRWAKLL
ncbi:MAG: hypothetical protein PV362_08935, partial [Providencia heimbachae]|nr:hypothetical protein [Providencia heimbachae]